MKKFTKTRIAEFFTITCFSIAVYIIDNGITAFQVVLIFLLVDLILEINKD